MIYTICPDRDKNCLRLRLSGGDRWPSQLRVQQIVRHRLNGYGTNILSQTYFAHAENRSLQKPV